MLLSLHILAGALAIVLGGLALLVRKGGTIHRRVGLLFVGSMLVMGSTAAALGVLAGANANVPSGVTVAYFVVTALVTVRPESTWTRRATAIGLALAICLSVFYLAEGVAAFNSRSGWRNGAPFQMLFFLAAVVGLAAVGDFRAVKSGRPGGRIRLGRHLWRMCFALFIAAGSFFSVPERVATILPGPLSNAPMRALPILTIFGSMFYWLWRIRRARRPSLVIRHDVDTLGTSVRD
jgi:hypothetical protein